MQTPPTVAADILLRVGTFLLLTAWIVGSGWLVLVLGNDIYSQWGSWRTYPLPDKRAIKHLVGLLIVLAVWALFLWFALVWFSL